MQRVYIISGGCFSHFNTYICAAKNFYFG